MPPDNNSAKCRTCSNPTNNIIYHTIFDYVENYKVMEMLNAIVPQIDYNTTPMLLSSVICKYCVEKLLIGYKFQQLCIETDKKFQDELEFNMFEVVQPKLENITDPLVESNSMMSEMPVEEIKTEISYGDSEMTEMRTEVIKNEVSYEIIEQLENNSADGFQDFGGDYILSENDVRQERNNTFIFECPKCTEVFEKMYLLTAHFKVHMQPPAKKKEKPKEMEIENNNDDDDEEEDIGGTKLITAKKNKETFFSCTLCGKLFDRIHSLNRHMNTVHNESRPHECEICKYRFATPNLLFSHLQQHEDNNDKLVITKSRLENLNSTEKNDDDTDCDKEEELDLFDTKKKKKDHQFPCKICGRMFHAAFALARHNNSVHSESRPYECDICKYRFETRKLFESHRKIQHEKNDNAAIVLAVERFKCPHCEETFPKLKLLVEHRKIHTNKPRKILPKPTNEPHLCTLCGKSYSTAHNLKDHLARHANLRLVQCPECPSRFNCHVDMISHAEVHKKDKRHICDRCGATFTRSYSLYMHTLAHTSKVKSFKCDQCPLTFTKPYTLKRHMRTHTGEKPYKCKYCDRAYAASGDLNKHLRTHVGTNTYMCDECPKAFKYLAELKDHKAEHYKMSLKRLNETAEDNTQKESPPEVTKTETQNDNQVMQEKKKIEVIDLKLLQNTE